MKRLSMKVMIIKRLSMKDDYKKINYENKT